MEPLTTTFRILLVDDFEPFRRFVRAALEPFPEFQLVGEALDGLEAIEKAKALQPHMILLDIGLPKLSGLAAAEEIRIVAPQAKLLFVSMESASEIVGEALRLGALGYVQKMRAHSDLIPAIQATRAGKQFVSSGFEFSDGIRSRGRHVVQFYSDDAVLLESAVPVVGEALKADGAAIVVATQAHREGFLQRLNGSGFDMNAAIRRGVYISLDAAAAVSTIMENGAPDAVRFSEIFGDLIRSCGKATNRQHPRIAWFGECLGLLCAEDKSDAAIQIERMANALLEEHDIDIFCAYPRGVFETVSDDSAFNAICSLHSDVLIR
jgi:CheY-like chemotaxis protein